MLHALLQAVSLAGAQNGALKTHGPTQSKCRFVEADLEACAQGLQGSRCELRPSRMRATWIQMPMTSVHGSVQMVADLEGSAAGGLFSQRRRLEPSGICATSSTSHLPPSFRPFTLLPSFSTTPDTCIT